MQGRAVLPDSSRAEADRVVQLSGPEDLAALLEFVAVCPDAPPWPLRAWSMFVEPDGTALAERVAFAVPETQSGGLRAVLMATRVEQRVEMEMLLVHPEDRRQGLGKRLCHLWLAWAAHKGATEAVLEVRRSNLAAQKLYEGAGFRIEGSRREYYHSPTEDAFVMRCLLVT